jgi:hypothetical protein
MLLLTAALLGMIFGCSKCTKLIPVGGGTTPTGGSKPTLRNMAHHLQAYLLLRIL